MPHSFRRNQHLKVREESFGCSSLTRTLKRNFLSIFITCSVRVIPSLANIDLKVPFASAVNRILRRLEIGSRAAGLRSSRENESLERTSSPFFGLQEEDLAIISLLFNGLVAQW
jgi:hypothetical protein